MSKTICGHIVLNNVNLTVRRGEITTLIGPSGSGKSTLLRAISLLEPPDEGTLFVDDLRYCFPNSAGTNPAPPWPRLTIVFQQLFLWPHLTIRQNIEFPISRDHGRHSIAKSSEYIDLLDLGPFADRFPNQVSIGQRQRAAIARALALKPDYLLLDEVTSALDVEYVSALLRQLQALRKAGTGILLVSHLLGFAKRSADNVIFMDHGEIVEQGGPEILVTPSTARLRSFMSLVATAE